MTSKKAFVLSGLAALFVVVTVLSLTLSLTSRGKHATVLPETNTISSEVVENTQPIVEEKPVASDVPVVVEVPEVVEEVVAEDQPVTLPEEVVNEPSKEEGVNEPSKGDVVASKPAADSRYTSLRQAATGAMIVYDFMCMKRETGNYIELGIRDNGTSYIKFAEDFPEVAVQVDLLVTPGNGKGNWKGHGEPDNLDVFHQTFGDTITLPPKSPIVKFNKGGPTAGSPLWDSATGNPYIYFQPRNGWTCTVVKDANKDAPFECPAAETCAAGAYDDACESFYSGKTPEWKTDQPCVFRANHRFSKNPHSDMDLEEDGPPRFKKFGDIFAGRCGEYHEDEFADFSIQCCTTNSQETVVSTGPSCASNGHNIGFGVSATIKAHHRIVASQVSPHKFIGCTSDDGNICASVSSGGWSCAQGAGPHETFSEETCFLSPPATALVDKSAGNNQGQTGEDCDFTTDGHFTGCGVGGNPCVTLFSCEIACATGFCPCVGETSDVLSALSCSGCHGGTTKYPPEANDACQCSDIRNMVAELTGVSCEENSSEEGSEESSEV